MKIICIGHNYRAHCLEMKHGIPEQPIFFCKPDSALLLKNRAFFIPEFSENIHYETEIVVKIDRLGKYIQEKFAPNYYHEIGIGFDFTARDIQSHCIEHGLPWEICKAFDQSAALGNFIPKDQLGDLQNLRFHMKKNGIICQEGNTSDMIFSIDKIISYVSQFMTLKIGDYIFTGTPSGVGKIEIGDRLEAFIHGQSLLCTEIK